MQKYLKVRDKIVDEFTASFIEAMLWSENDESTPEGGEPLDKNYTVYDLAPETLDKIIDECKKFQNEFGHLLTEENLTKQLQLHSVLEYAGHDAWLTSRGHGCGFWDGDWEEDAGSKLTDGCKKVFKESDAPYVGDDGLIYL